MINSGAKYFVTLTSALFIFFILCSFVVLLQWKGKGKKTKIIMISQWQNEITKWHKSATIIYVHSTPLLYVYLFSGIDILAELALNLVR